MAGLGLPGKHPLCQRAGSDLTAQSACVTQPGAMEFFLHNLTKPDNIALVIMFFFTILTVTVAVREMIANDRLIKKGEKDKIYERMTKI